MKQVPIVEDVQYRRSLGPEHDEVAVQGTLLDPTVDSRHLAHHVASD